MSNKIPPIQPVSRIESINPIAGISDTDPSLYQIALVSLITLFQKALQPFQLMTHPSLPLTSIQGVMPIQRNYRGGKKKLRFKKERRSSQKILTLFKQALD